MMKINIICLIAMILLTGCSLNVKNKTDEITYTQISQDEAKKMMDDNDDIIILDVRIEEEYNTGYIKDAILLPVTEIKEKAEEVLKNKEQIILVYCRSGNRSKTASQELVDLGYKNIYEFGGINTWKYDIVK